MRTVFPFSGAALALALLASPAFSQPRPAADEGPAVHRLEITNGPVRSVHYVGQGMSPGDRAALRDMERAENELALADAAFFLKAQYLGNETYLQGRRTGVQNLLYGYNAAVQNAGLSAYAGWPGGWGGGWAYGVPNVLPTYASYPFGFGGGYGGFGGVAAAATQESVFSLAAGVGDEGVLKTAMAPVVAQAMTPEYRAAAARNLDVALARVGASDALRTALKLGPRREPGAALVGYEKPAAGAALEVTRKVDGKDVKLAGTYVGEDDDWLVLQTPEGKRSLRKSEVVEILEKKK
jgi:hypothetical protein